MITRSSLASIALSAAATASTYTVDDTPGPGVDFNDIPPAIAFAQPGDVLLVAPGDYSGFTLDKGLVLVGSNSVIGGPIEIRNLPAGTRAAVVSMRSTAVVVDSCAATVLLQELTQVRTMSIAGSIDVRIARTTVSSLVDDSLDALTIDGSRVEIVDGAFQGHRGLPSGVPGGTGGGGGAGIELRANARLVASNLVAGGGAGSLEGTLGTYAGPGGWGIDFVTGNAVLIGPSSSVSGGAAGWNWGYFECGFDGFSAPAIGPGPGSLVSSATTFHTVPFGVGFHCIPFTPPYNQGVSHTTVSPNDPTLMVVGTPTAGGSITLAVRGEVGAPATLVLGRGFVVTPTPGVPIEELVTRARVIALGTPPGGAVDFPLPIPSYLPRGFVFGAQAEVLGSNGLRRTCSASIVVR